MVKISLELTEQEAFILSEFLEGRGLGNIYSFIGLKSKVINGINRQIWKLLRQAKQAPADPNPPVENQISEAEKEELFSKLRHDLAKIYGVPERVLTGLDPCKRKP